MSLYTVIDHFLVKFDKTMNFSIFFLQNEAINFEKNPLVIQIFYSQQTPNVFLISTNEKKYWVILIIKFFMTDFRLILIIFFMLNEKIYIFQKFINQMIFPS